MRIFSAFCALVFLVLAQTASAHRLRINGAADEAPPDKSVTDYSGNDAGTIVISLESSQARGEGAVDWFALDFRSTSNASVDGTLRYEKPASINLSGRKVDFNSPDGLGVVIVRRLAPGEYVLNAFRAEDTDVWYDVSFRVPFTVKAGQTTYLGNFRYTEMSENYSAGGYFVVTNKHDRDVPIALGKPNAPAGDIVDLVPDVASVHLPMFQTAPMQPHGDAELAAKMLKSGFHMLGKNNAGAIETLSAALATDALCQEYQAAAYNWIGDAYLYQSRYSDAIREFDAALKLDLELADAYGNRGMAYGHVGNPVQEMADETEAIRLKPMAEWYNHLSLADMDLGMPDKAIGDSDEAVRLDPSDAMVWRNRAANYIQLAQYEKAIPDAEHAITLKSDFSVAYVDLCYAQSQSGRQQGAIADCTRAIQLDPGYGFGWQSRGVAQMRLGHYPEAIADLDKALSIFKRSAYAQFERGVAKQRNGDMEGGNADIAAARAAAPGMEEQFATHGVRIELPAATK